MKVNKSLLAVLSIFLILLVFISSASAANTNATSDVLSVDESVNLENNTLALDSSSNNAVSNDNKVVENNEILQNPNSDDVLGGIDYLDFPDTIYVGQAF